MQDLHWRYNFNTKAFESVGKDSRQHYEPLLKNVHVPTLVIDINLIHLNDLDHYVKDVLCQATVKDIKYSQIIFDGTQDPVVDYKSKTVLLNNIAGRLRTRCFFSLSQFDLSSHQHLTEINYPSWFFVFKKQQLPTIFPTHVRDHAFSCLNRNPSFHRLVFYSMMKDLGLLDRFIYSFYDRCPYQGYVIKPHNYRNLSGLIGEELAQKCFKDIADFPIAWNSEVLGDNDHSVQHDAYTNAWCNVVTETSALMSFTSEKIWKPIASGQLFLVVGAPGTTAWLKRLGFKTFEDAYDLKQNFVSRLHMVSMVVEKHKDDAQDWWNQNESAIRHNFHWFHSGNVEKMILDPLVSLLNGERS